MARCSEKGCKAGGTLRRYVSEINGTVKTRPVCKEHALETSKTTSSDCDFYSGFKILVANGPPGSGKDTAINQCVENLNFKGRVFKLSYKKVLYAGVAKRFNLDLDYVISLNENRDTKELPMECFGGLSVRQALISESEDHIKPMFGEEGVANFAISELLDIIKPTHGEPILLLNSDGGFNIEIDYVKRRLGLSNDQLFVIRLLRRNHSFQGDSREFIKNPNIIINNDLSIESLKSKLIKPIQTWLNK